MLRSLKIQNYRTFANFSVGGLTPVNLFVGKNNCGKTSLLEAAELLSSAGNPEVVIGNLSRRGEYNPGADRNLNIAHLFHGHDIRDVNTFSIEGENKEHVKVTCAIEDIPSGGHEELFIEDQEAFLAVFLRYSGHEKAFPIGVREDGAINSRDLRHALFRLKDSFCFHPVQFVSTSVIRDNLGTAWNSVALTPEEEQVTQAVRIVEPRIERIALLDTDKPSRPRTASGIFVKLSGNEKRIHLGSMGEGMERVFRLLTAVNMSANGAVMIDEIDTGIHYSVLSNVWRMIIETARRLNVQVFATTHSQDCIWSIARLHEVSPELAEDVSLHRIDAEYDTSTPYSADELVVASRHDMELR